MCSAYWRAAYFEVRENICNFLIPNDNVVFIFYSFYTCSTCRSIVFILARPCKKIAGEDSNQPVHQSSD